MKNWTKEMNGDESAKIRKATHEKWMRIESTPRYRIVTTQAVCGSIIQKIEIEVIDYC